MGEQRDVSEEVMAEQKRVLETQMAEQIRSLQAQLQGVEARMAKMEESLHQALSSSIPKVDAGTCTGPAVGVDAPYPQSSHESSAVSAARNPAQRSVKLHEAAARGDVAQLQQLLEDGASVSAVDSQGDSALHAAAAHGRAEAVEALLAAEAEVKQRGRLLRSALHVAAINGHQDVVELLLDAGMPVEVKDVQGATALCLAAEAGQDEVVEFLLERKASLAVVDDCQRTPILRAALASQWDTVQMLVDNTLQQNYYITSKYYKVHGDCALELAARAGANAAFLSLLKLMPLLEHAGRALGQAADATVVWAVADADLGILKYSQMGYTALCSAALNGHQVVLQALLDAGVNPATPNGSDKSALHCAAEKGHAECLATLIEAFSDIRWRCVEDINLEDREQGNTALHLAASNGHVDCVNILFEGGAKVDAKNKMGETPLQSAAYGGHIDCLTVLLEKGADVNHNDNNGQSALCIVASRGYVTCLNALLEKGADVNHINECAVIRHPVDGNNPTDCISFNGMDVFTKMSWTALHVASNQGHKECVRALCQAGALATVTDAKGRTAFQVAANKGIQQVLNDYYR